MRATRVLPLLLLLSLPGLALAQAPTQARGRSSAGFDKSALIQSVSRRFLEKQYVKPEHGNLQRYQTWGGGRNFVTIVDDTGDFENGNWNNNAALDRILTGSLDKYYDTQPDVAQFVVFFSAFQVPFPGAFYLPLSNDTRGLGYKHSMPGGQEVFDSTPRSPLDGIVVMNDYTLWGPINDLASVFNQEVGHRWGAFVHYQLEADTVSKDLLLGRDLAHWSYFMDSGGSPMEGNGWRENADSTFTSTSSITHANYHPLDLYLMGLIPPAEVPDFYFIDSPDLSALGTAGRNINRSTGPSWNRAVTIGGTKQVIGIGDIIRAEGVRVPASDVAPKQFKIGFVLVVRKGQQTNQNILSEFDDTLDELVTRWRTATGNRASLEVVSSGPPAPAPLPLGDPCEGIYECDGTQATACIAPKVDPSVGKHCAKRCSADEPCPTGLCCAPANLIGDPRYCFAESLNICPAPPPDAGPPAVPDGGATAVADGGTSGGGGGGGCTVAGSNAAGSALVWLALAAVLGVLRRRAAAR